MAVSHATLGAMSELTGATTLRFSTRDQAGGFAPEVEVPLGPAFLERFELQQVLGRGGMGMVVQAYDRNARATVAIKFMSREDDPHMVRRFLREGRLLRQLSHRNLVPVLEVGNQAGHPYLVMPLIDGGSLQTAIAGGRIAFERAAEIALDVAEGLAACHLAGIVHRDLKPANVLLDSSGRAYLADLGIAKVAAGSSSTMTGQLLGTPLYMAPEQLDGSDASPASDVHAAGVVFHELFSGRVPWRTGSIPDAFDSIMQDVPRRLTAAEAPPAVAELVAQALEKDPARRPKNAVELADRLREAMDLPPLSRVPVAPLAARPDFSTWAGVAVVCAVYALLIFGWPSFSFRSGERRLPTAKLEARFPRSYNRGAPSWSSSSLKLVRREGEEVVHWTVDGRRLSAFALPDNYPDPARPDGGRIYAPTRVGPAIAVRVAHDTVEVFRTADGQRLLTRRLQSRITDGVPAPDGRWVLLRLEAGAQRSYRRLFLSDGAMEPTGLPGDVHIRELSPDGSLATAWSRSGVDIFKIDSGARLWSAPGGHSVTIGPDGRTVFLAAPDGTVMRHDPSGKPLPWPGKAPTTGQPGFSRNKRADVIALSPDGKLLVTNRAPTGAVVWDARSGERLMEIALGDRTHDAKFSPDGRWLLLADPDNACTIWDLPATVRARN
jgi:serine/threonine protein kinase